MVHGWFFFSFHGRTWSHWVSPILKTLVWVNKHHWSRFILQLDSLKPKESLVIRQRYGLDGKGDRTLGEIAGNLNISREMVRKHEVKALMKLKHQARVDYLRQYIIWNQTELNRPTQPFECVLGMVSYFKPYYNVGIVCVYVNQSYL